MVFSLILQSGTCESQFSETGERDSMKARGVFGRPRMDHNSPTGIASGSGKWHRKAKGGEPWRKIRPSGVLILVASAQQPTGTKYCIPAAKAWGIVCPLRASEAPGLCRWRNGGCSGIILRKILWNFACPYVFASQCSRAFRSSGQSRQASLLTRPWIPGTHPGQRSGQRPQTQIAGRIPCGEGFRAWRVTS
jgi:hypothetical protein